MSFINKAFEVIIKNDIIFIMINKINVHHLSFNNITIFMIYTNYEY